MPRPSMRSPTRPIVHVPTGMEVRLVNQSRLGKLRFAALLVTQNRAQAALADRHRCARAEGEPQELVIRPRIAPGQGRNAAIKPPRRGRVASGKLVDEAG